MRLVFFSSSLCLLSRSVFPCRSIYLFFSVFEIYKTRIFHSMLFRRIPLACRIRTMCVSMYRSSQPLTRTAIISHAISYIELYSCECSSVFVSFCACNAQTSSVIAMICGAFFNDDDFLASFSSSCVLVDANENLWKCFRRSAAEVYAYFVMTRVTHL